MAPGSVVVALMRNRFLATMYSPWLMVTVSVADGLPERSTRLKLGLLKEACFEPAIHKPPEESLVISFNICHPVVKPGIFSLLT